MSITFSECVFGALVIQHGKRTRRITLSSVACLAVPNFFHITSYPARLSGKVIEYKICVLIYSTVLSENFLILRRKERDMIKKCVLVFM
jgi:hypothetical protein